MESVHGARCSSWKSVHGARCSSWKSVHGARCSSVKSVHGARCSSWKSVHERDVALVVRAFTERDVARGTRSRGDVARVEERSRSEM